MTLARRHDQGAIKIRDIAAESDLPEKFLELILLEMKNARIVDSVRGARGGYRLRRDPAELPLSDIIRLIDGPLAPMGDAEQLRGLIAKDADHRALYEVFLEVRDAAAKILENTTIADIMGGGKGRRRVRSQPHPRRSAPPKPKKRWRLLNYGGDSRPRLACPERSRRVEQARLPS